MKAEVVTIDDIGHHLDLVISETSKALVVVLDEVLELSDVDNQIVEHITQFVDECIVVPSNLAAYPRVAFFL